MKNKSKFLLFLSLVYIFGFFLVWPQSEVSEISSTQIGEDLTGADHIISFGPSPSLVTEESTGPGEVVRTYFWDYGGYISSLSVPLDDKVYKMYDSRTRNRDYDLFASDPYDDSIIKGIAENLSSLSKEYGLEEKEIPEFCASFVQSLNYTSDLETAGCEQYPRFPYETLYQNGGDCEDTSVLAVAILQEMGYDVVLLELPEHMAIGINRAFDQEGKCFEFNGKRYYYLETTGRSWKIGELPEEYIGQSVKVVPVYRRPLANLDFKAQCEYSKVEGVIDVSVSLRNVGSEEAKNASIYVALQDKDGIHIWDGTKSSSLVIKPESVYNYTARGLIIPAGKTFRVYVQAKGENFISENITSDWVTI